MKPVSYEGYKLLHDGLIALAQVEANGMRIDVDRLQKTTNQVTRKIRTLTEEIKQDKVFKLWRKTYGGKTNLGSVQQLGHVIFNLLGYPCPSKTPTGRNQADEYALSTVRIPFTKKYLEIKKLDKARGTYLRGIQNEVVDGFLHPVFNLHLASTFRSSCSNPNLQNIPVRNALIGELIRKCFIPRKDHVMAEIDFGAIEVRVAACYNHDPVLIEYIEDPTKDMHRDMAAQCYRIPKEEVSKQSRYCAKNMFVFPEFYGSYYPQCAKPLWEAIRRMGLQTNSGRSLKESLAAQGIRKLGHCIPGEAAVKGTFEYHIKEVEENFWNKRFKVYRDWKKKWHADYQKRGGFSTLTGFYIEGIFGKNDVVNYPIQGSAFHCLLWSLIQLQKWLTKHRMKSLIIGQIHDSLILDIHKSELTDVLFKARQIMTRDLRKAWDWIIVPIEVEAETSDDTWFDKKPYKFSEN